MRLYFLFLCVILRAWPSLSQDTLLRRNTISIYLGPSTETFGIKYSRIIHQKVNRFTEIEAGGGTLIEFMRFNGTSGITFNYGKKKNYFAWGLHFNCLVIDFFGTSILYGPNLSLGLHHRLNKFDLKLRIMGGLDFNRNLGLFLPGASMSVGWSF